MLGDHCNCPTEQKIKDENANQIIESLEEEREAGKEKVVHPPHYNMGKIEVIDVIEDWNLGFNDGNVIKYVGRARHKGNQIEDLQKALWYLVRHMMVDGGLTKNNIISQLYNMKIPEVSK